MKPLLVQPCVATRPDCPNGADQTVVTVHGYVIDCCGRCARALCDPLGGWNR